MNFQQLEYILAVHRQGHFGLAAESCHVTQATLSAMIIKLEDELNVQIFDRSRKPVKTTEAGLKILEIAKQILAKQIELQKIQKPSDELTGTLRVGIIPTIAPSLLPLVLPEIIKENPDLRLSISEMTTDEILHQLEMDKIDLGILATPINNDRFEEHILYYESMMVYGIESDSDKPLKAKDIHQKNIWLLEEGHCFRNQAVTLCELTEKKSSESNLNINASSFETLLGLTDQFGGITLIPELYYSQLDSERKQRTRTFATPVPVREISLVTFRKHVNDFTIQHLTKTIQKKVKGQLMTSHLQNKDLDIIGI
ncbi:MAG: LysR family transcriptional regulator [Flavobacteriales bacterium]|nr:LysR family transcriptional regulator [Flavobacteriales bacterium]MCB9197963.1 LysR family transcriptional regulator [Flavobacteriales bacterium]